MSNSTFICPFPLQYAYEEKDLVLWVYEAGNCAAPCPTLAFSVKEWNDWTNALLVLCIATFVCSFATIIALSQDFHKNFIRLMFTSGFFLLSLILAIFFIVNIDDDVVCKDNVYFIESSHFCIFQAASIIFLFLWIEIWSSILAVDTYLHIISSLQKEKIHSLHKQYFIFSVIICSVITLIPLCVGNLGFDPYASIPVCLYKFSKNPYYFWGTLFAPFIFLNGLCCIVTLAGSYKIYNIFIRSMILSNWAAKHQDNRESVESVPSPFIDHEVFQSQVNGTALKRNYSGQKTNISENLENLDTHIVPTSSVDTDDMPNLNIRLTLDALRSISTNTAIPGDLSIVAPSRDSEYASGANMLNFSKSRDRDMDRDSRGMGNSTAHNAVNNNNQPSRSASVLSSNTIDTISSLNTSSKFDLVVGTVCFHGGRSILFVICFCLTTGVLCYYLVLFFDIKYDYYINATRDYATCLAEASASSGLFTQEEVDLFAQHKCGQVPSDRPKLSEVSHDMLC